MATIANFDEEFAAITATALKSIDVLPIHEGSSNTKKQITGAQAKAEDYIAAGSALTLVAATHGGKIIKLDTLAGSTVTLPAATGSGVKFRFVISVIPTSNNHKVQVANASDTMAGVVFGLSDDPATMKGWLASGTGGGGSDTITLNRSTTGGTAVGEYIEVADFALNLWTITGCIAQTGTEATPFSAAV
jgi:hypothetical protein